MGALWQKNQPTASLRRCDLLPAHNDDGTAAPRGTDFTGFVYVSQDGNDYALGTGTITNCRRALVVADDTVESVDTGADTMTLTAHGYETGDGPFIADEAVGGLGVATDFWIISVDANTIQIAASLADAYAGAYLSMVGTEAAAIISDKATTQRGLDGKFRYTASQAETNYDTAEIAVVIAGHATYSAYTTVDMATESASVWSTVIENGLTAEDLLRICARFAGANFSVVGTLYTYRDLADTKDSHHGTITASGRSSAAVDDAT
jgi:hypothetical protein